jgi:hypothetical protein
MAEDNVRINQTAPVLIRNIVVKDKICECCDIIQTELDELKLELKSCREIIRILQEEARVSTTMPHEVWDIPNGELIEKTQTNSWHQGNGWQNSTNQRRRPQKISRQLQQIPLHTSNKFELLLNLKDDTEKSKCSRMDRRYKVKSDNMMKSDKQKIVITGDSHARNCAPELLHQLKSKCIVSGYVNPGRE